jgi:hypothetical protein
MLRLTAFTIGSFLALQLTACRAEVESRSIADPVDMLVLIQQVTDGTPSLTTIGFVCDVGDDRAYLHVAGLPSSRQEDANRPKKEVRYFALVGPAENAQRVELTFVVGMEEDRISILSGPRNTLPPPLPEMTLPERKVGSAMTFVGLRITGNNPQPNIKRVRESVKLARILADRDGLAIGFQMSGSGGDGFLIDEQGALLSICRGQGDRFYAFGSRNDRDIRRLCLTELRTRISRPSADEAVVEFAVQTIDPLMSDLRPLMLVSHPTKSQAKLPDHELLHGDDSFMVSNGTWLKPNEGTPVEMQRVESVEADFNMPPAPSDWCRPALWYGSYRFRISERVTPVWYQGAATNSAGKIVRMLGRDSHLDLPKSAGEAILFTHPVDQYEQGTPVPLPSFGQP